MAQWTEKEVEVLKTELRRNVDVAIDRVVRALKEGGFRRSREAVRKKRKELQLGTEFSGLYQQRQKALSAPPKKPKVLFFDVETAPSVAYIWRMWEEVSNMDMVAEDWYMLCWCAKWEGKKTIHSGSLPDYKLYNEEPKNDFRLIQGLWTLLDEADIVIAHNACKFDVRKINTRFVTHNMSPPSPYAIIDTLKIAKKHFAFTSNKLDNLGKLLGLGEKVPTGGFKLWENVMAGDLDAWDHMVTYCAQDVKLLEAVFHRLKAYANNLPNRGTYSGKKICSRCGSTNIVKDTRNSHTKQSQYELWHCKDCGGWDRNKKRAFTSPLVGVQTT